MTYPVRVGSPPKRVDETLLRTTDARIWAKEFVRLHGGDRALMTSWFASAIELGRDAGRQEALTEN